MNSWSNYLIKIQIVLTFNSAVFYSGDRYAIVSKHTHLFYTPFLKTPLKRQKRNFFFFKL